MRKYVIEVNNEDFGRSYFIRWRLGGADWGAMEQAKPFLTLEGAQKAAERAQVECPWKGSFRIREVATEKGKVNRIAAPKMCKAIL